MSERIALAVDTTRSLCRLVKRAERYTDYHVRGVYSNGDDDVQSVSVTSARYLRISGIDKTMEAQGAKFVGYAVYGCGPEGYHVCGDELSYRTCIIIAAILNRVYNDRTIFT